MKDKGGKGEIYGFLLFWVWSACTNCNFSAVLLSIWVYDSMEK